MTPNLSDGTIKSSSSSEAHGLLGRVIENWLTNVNERQYQIPFCQVLAAEGETILQVSTHGPLEKGKDIVTRTTTGVVRAYQLKAGDIGLAEWRKIRGEVIDLVELAVELPGTSPIAEFVPYLVTNGQFTAPVLEAIRVQNVSWRARGIKRALQVIQKGEMLDRFRSSHGSFLPRELVDFRLFLELILRDGSAPAEKEKAARLIEGIVLPKRGSIRALDAVRAAASIVLLVAYISGPAALACNHWGVFEYWVLAGAYILYLSEGSQKAEGLCQVSFGLCEAAAENALAALARECKERGDLIEGSPLVDGHAYGARVTLLIGLLSAWDLSLRIRCKKGNKDEFVESFLISHLNEAQLWGESAVPYLFLAALVIKESCRPLVAEGIVAGLVHEISTANGPSAAGPGLPNPYYSPEGALRRNYGLDPLNPEQFVGSSYAVGPLIDFLARSWRRRTLASLWYGLTRMSLVEYMPSDSREWFRWRSSSGALDSRLPGEPQSWEALRMGAEAVSFSGLPRTLVKRPAFVPWFTLVYPHRFTRRVARLIEDAFS